MGIKEIPTNFRVYYKTMHDSIRPKYEEAVANYEKLLVEEKAIHSELIGLADYYNSVYKFNFSDYPELIDNNYIDGTFYDHAKGLFINKKNNYKATSPLYKLYKVAMKQKELHNLKHQLDIWERMLDLTLDEYKQVLQTFYNEVHKKLIIDGYGYVFENPMGWLCINRCKVVNGKSRVLDFKATKANKEKLIAEGKRLWNKEEAAYAAQVGIDYEGVDYRVYKDEEYCYEFSLVNCRVIPGEKIQFKTTDSHRGLAGKNEDDVIAECNNDLNKICSLNINPSRKLYMCLKANDILYLNFIRNEGQQSVKTPKANRKNRQ